MRVIVALGIAATVAAADVGAQLAQAQKRGDIMEIQRLMRDLRSVRGTEGLHALMKQLDPKRSGAFVSAPCIARRLLLNATATGDTRFVADAAKIMRTHATQKKSGKCAQAMRHYADGLEAAIAKDDKRSAQLLDKALEIMLQEEWTPPAMHAAVELASISLRAGDPAAAAAAIGSLAKVFPRGADPSLRSIIRSLYGDRLKDAPDEVKRAYEKVMAPHSSGMSVSAAGGAAGRPGGQSKVGAALSDYSKRKALVTVQRGRKGFEIKQGFDRSFSATQPVKHGLKYHANGGVTLGFWNYAVGLYMIDPTGRKGQPGESSVGPGPLRACYFLARKEKWAVTKTGVVTISPR